MSRTPCQTKRLVLIKTCNKLEQAVLQKVTRPRPRILCLQYSNKAATCSFTDLENLKPFPKAAERKVQLGRKKRKSEILKDTPIKDALEEEKTK